MFLKWIVCQVPVIARASFSSAQGQWTMLYQVPGFLGQIGGWDRTLQAGILSCWRDEASYRFFMKHVHDEIVEHTHQRETYTSLSVAFFEDLLPIAGSQPDFLAALTSGTALRVTYSHLLEGKDQPFIRNQTTIWNLGMAQTEGMCAGVFAQATDHSSRYLVASLWDDLQAHQVYMETLFPLLREQANLPQVLRSIQGWVLQLEKTWQVLV